MSQNRGESYGKSESLNCVLYALFILAKEAANLRVSVSLLLGQWVRVLGLVRAAYLSPWRDVASSVENVQSVIHHLYEPCIKNVFFISRDFFLEFYSFDRTIKRFSTLLEMGKGNRTKLKTFLWISGVLFSKQSGSVVRYKKKTNWVRTSFSLSCAFPGHHFRSNGTQSDLSMKWAHSLKIRLTHNLALPYFIDIFPLSRI